MATRDSDMKKGSVGTQSTKSGKTAAGASKQSSSPKAAPARSAGGAKGKGTTSSKRKTGSQE